MCQVTKLDNAFIQSLPMPSLSFILSFTFQDEGKLLQLLKNVMQGMIELNGDTSKTS